MKKRITHRIFCLALVFILLAFALAACVYPTHTVTFVLGDGRENVVAEVSGAGLDYVPDAPSEDMVFAGWFKDEARTKPYLSKSVLTDITLYARFVKKGSAVVTFVYGDGITPDTTLVMSGALTEPKEPTRAGYIFNGWRNEATGQYYEFGTEPAEAFTVLSAVWQPVLSGVRFTVNLNGGGNASVSTLQYNAKPSVPSTPFRDGFVFTGWYANAECTAAFDFDAPLTKNTTVYAGWLADAGALGNELALGVLKAAVKVKVEQYEIGFLGSTNGIESVGSGIIYAKQGGYYYILTNEHVIERGSKYPNIEYTVYDAFGNEHEATLMAHDAAYDLAVVRIAVPEDSKLAVAKLGENDPARGDFLISVGNPGGLVNTVTYGNLCFYAEVPLSSGSSLDFEVGCHNAPIDHGSSGGAVLNDGLVIVGINFASATSSDGTALGAFIQISQVRKFLAASGCLFGL